MKLRKKLFYWSLEKITEVESFLTSPTNSRWLMEINLNFDEMRVKRLGKYDLLKMLVG